MVLDKLYGTLNELGLTYNALKEYDDSELYHKKALETVIKYNLQDKEHQVAVCYNNLGFLFQNQEKHKKAVKNFENGLLDKSILQDDPDLFALLIDNLAYSKLKLKEYKNIFGLFKRALNIRDSLNYTSGIISSKIHLSEYYEVINDTTNSILYSKEALKLAKDYKNPFDIAYSLKRAAVVDKKNASSYINDYIRIDDSIQDVENKNKDRFARIQLETNEITQEKEKAISQKWLYSSIIALVLLIVILLFTVYFLRNQKNKLFMLQAQQQANESIYQLMLNQNQSNEKAKQLEKKRIALELHDNILNKLAGTRLNLYTISKKTDTATITNALTHIDKIKDIEDEIRTLSHDLSVNIFPEANNFKELIKELIHQQNTTYITFYSIELEEDINWELIDAIIKMNLYRIIQEALYNTNKYANATTGILTIIKDEANICMSVVDNGIGFDTNKIKDGIGIANIKQRINALNGSVAIVSKNNSGTTINCKIPLVN